MQFIEDENIQLNSIYETWVATADNYEQCVFSENDFISNLEHPYSQCVVGQYLFIELSNQASANLRITTRVYKMIS